MLEVDFYNKEDIEDSVFKFAVICATYKTEWIYCKHKDRDTWEIPGGHRGPGEPVDTTAKRELYEETGAVDFDLTPVCAYSVKNGKESFGMLYYANISALADLPESEIEKIDFFIEIPDKLTYPLIQPKLAQKVIEFIR